MSPARYIDDFNSSSISQKENIMKVFLYCDFAISSYCKTNHLVISTLSLSRHSLMPLGSIEDQPIPRDTVLR